jgi:hypothetical protein
MDNGSRAHRARFNRRIDGRTRESIIADRHAGLSQCHDFCVRCRIARPYYPIAPTSNDLIIENDDCADWDLTFLASGFGLFQSDAHELFIVRFHDEYFA